MRAIWDCPASSMIISIIGPSGSGKGTQAQKLAQKLNLPTVSVGEILRQEAAAGTEEGEKVKEYLDRGKWVPVDLFFKVIRQHLEDKKFTDGFILDGAPRRRKEIELWEDYLARRGQKIDLVFHLDTPDETCVKRIQNRVQKQREEGQKVRSDESEATIRSRLKEYHQTITPILAYFKQQGNLVKINNEQPIGAVFADIVAHLPKELS